MKIPIYGTGLSGLVGSRVTELLRDKYEFTDLSLTTGVDITDFDQVEKSLKASPAKVIIHMAAKTDVDGCEDDKIQGDEGSCWLVNTEGTKNIVEAARRYAKRVIYISTDFVFDGTKDFYTEEDTPNPVNWYGYTKYEGEKIVQSSGISYAIIRLAYPYRAYFEAKQDFVRRILDKAKESKKIPALSDHIFTPTFIDDIVMALDLLMSRELTGIYHVVGSQNLTPYIATEMIIKMFHLSTIVYPVSRNDYFKDRAFRPFKLALKNDKITKLGIRMKSFDEGLQKVKEQLL